MKAFIFAFFVILFVSCDSDDGSIPVDYRAENELEIQEYISQNNLDATATGSGLYYVIEEQGDGAEITASSDVSVRFKGVFTDGSLLAETTDEGLSFNLQNPSIIKGLREGLQLFNEGGTGILLVPSHLAFGDEDSPNVPAGSVVIYEIEMIDYEAENKAEIIKYISDNNLQATETDTGLFYVVEEQGTGNFPVDESTVTVAYKGTYTNGDVFDESDDEGITAKLNVFIPGWIEGLKHFNEGGKGKLLIPSSLAYGRYGRQEIPGGAVLVFDVSMLEVAE